MPSTLETLVREYLRFLEGSPREEHGDLQELIRLLDELAIARSRCPEAVPPEGDEPDDEDWPDLMQPIAARFPRFGWYNVVRPLDETPGEGKLLMGDAIDDLRDIAHDLRVALWHLENHGLEDGQRSFAFLFDIHWGQHLRELQLYLHELRTKP